MSLGNCLGEPLVRCLLWSLGHSPRMSLVLCPTGNSAVCSTGSSPLSPEVCVRYCCPDCSRGCVRVCVPTCLPVYSPASLPESPQRAAPANSSCRMQNAKVKMAEPGKRGTVPRSARLALSEPRPRARFLDKLGMTGGARNDRWRGESNRTRGTVPIFRLTAGTEHAEAGGNPLSIPARAFTCVGAREVLTYIRDRHHADRRRAGRAGR
jgi:hypothetical protein